MSCWDKCVNRWQTDGQMEKIILYAFLSDRDQLLSTLIHGPGNACEDSNCDAELYTTKPETIGKLSNNTIIQGLTVKPQNFLDSSHQRTWKIYEHKLNGEFWWNRTIWCLYWSGKYDIRLLIIGCAILFHEFHRLCQYWPKDKKNENKFKRHNLTNASKLSLAIWNTS